MKIEIWSDIMCPFCYIGKRNFENALSDFPEKNAVEVEWKSFQLNPSAKYNPDKDIYDYLADSKGVSRESSVRMHNSVTETARRAGLDYRFDLAKAANTFDAHRLIQFAKTRGLADAVEERLFRAYFTEGALVSDHATLVRLAGEAGLDEAETAAMLSGEDFSEAVHHDGQEARLLGIGGVPFFVIDRKYGISGAQPTEVFAQALEKAYKAARRDVQNPAAQGPEGAACTTDGECV